MLSSMRVLILSIMIQPFRQNWGTPENSLLCRAAFIHVGGKTSRNNT
jgi:hypothetical protein